MEGESEDKPPRRRGPKPGTPRRAPARKAKDVSHITDWRQRRSALMTVFDDEAKAVYLDALAEHGRRGDAARAAGVTGKCVRDHIKNDPDFMEAVNDAVDQYRDKVIGHHQDRIFNGDVIKKFDNEGNLVEERTVYPDNLIALELKKVDKSYREGRGEAVDPNAPGVAFGVLVVPAQLTREEAIKKIEHLRATQPPPSTLIDADFEEV